MTGANRQTPRLRVSEPEAMLFALISDFLRRRGLHRAADAMNMETEQDWTMSFMQAAQHYPGLGQTQAGFLADWFIVFWDLYVTRLQHRRQSAGAVHHSQPNHVNNLMNNQVNMDKRQLIQRFMSVIGLGNRDPSTLSDEERQYLMSMVQRYSSQPVPVTSPNGSMAMASQAPPKRFRADPAPTGVSIPGQTQHGPIGTFTPQFPPPPPVQSSLSAKQSPRLQQASLSSFPPINQPPLAMQSPPTDQAAMDRMMANMLSSVIGGTLDPMTLPMSPNNNNNNPPQQQQPANKLPQKRPASQPVSKPTASLIPPSPNTSRPGSTKEQPPSLLYSPDFANNTLNMITPLSLTPPPQPFMDEMESIMLSSGGSSKSDKLEYSLELVRKLYDCDDGVKVTAIMRWKQYVFVGRKDGKLAMVRVDNGHKLTSSHPHNLQITNIISVNDLIVTSGHDRFIAGHGIRNGQLVELFRAQCHQSAIQSMIGWDGNRLASCDSEGHLVIWDLAGQDKLHMAMSLDTKQVGPNTQYHLSRSEDGRLIAMAIGDEVWIVGSDDVKIQHKINGKTPVTSVTFSHGLLICTSVNLCTIYDPKDNFTIRHTSPSLPDKIFSCTLIGTDSKDMVAVLGSYQRVFLWTVGTNTVSQRHIHEGIVACVEPYREGNMLITGGHDGAVKLLRLSLESADSTGQTEGDDIDAVLRNFA